MPRARSQIVPIQSASPATPRNSPQRMASLLVGIAHESLAPIDLSRFRSRPESAPSNPSALLDPPFQKRAASPRFVRSSARTAPPSSVVAVAHCSLSPTSPASADSPPAAAAPPVRIPSPGNPPLPTEAPPLPSSPYPAPKPLAPALHFPAPASTAKTKFRS